jgi:hypothetical protein
MSPIFCLPTASTRSPKRNKKKEDFARESRSILRIPANDDRSIPAPNEDEELRAMGIEPPVD